MRKHYFFVALLSLFATTVFSSNLSPVISGNFSICLPGPMTSQLSATGTPAVVNPWTSTNTAVATISNNGLVTATGVFGTTIITFLNNFGESASVNVYVSTYPSISSPSGNYTLCQDEQLQLSGTLFPNTITPWASSNPAIATVDNQGLVTGVSGGTCSIIYMNLGGCTTSHEVTIQSILSPTITCGVWMPNLSKRFDWTSIPGATTYSVVYQINGGAFISGGSGNALTYTVSNVQQTDTVSLFVIPSGSVGNCFGAGTVTCQSSTLTCPEAGFSGSATVCSSDSTPINLNTIISGQDSGGTWSRTSGVGGIFNATNGTFIPTNATVSTFTYTVTGTTPCPNDTSTATIDIVAQPDAGTLSGYQIICVAETTVFSSTQPNGVWASANTAVASVNPLTGVINGLSAGSTTITYTVSGGVPCPSATATRMVTVDAPPSLNLTSSPITALQTVCLNSPITPITFSVNTTNCSASGLPPGVTASLNSNVFTISGTPTVAGTFQIIVSASTNCDIVPGYFVTIVVNPNVSLVLTSSSPTANQSLCNHTPIMPVVFTIGNGATGAALVSGSVPNGIQGDFDALTRRFTLSGEAMESGTFNYVVATTGGCGSASLTGTIVVHPTLDYIFCDFSQVTTPTSVFFDWAPIPGVSNYEYSYSIAGGSMISGTTGLSHYEVFGVLPGQEVFIRVVANSTLTGCSGEASFVCSYLANDAFEADNLQYFPNPVDDILSITNIKTDSNLEVLNTMGQQIYHKALVSKDTQIDMSALHKGMYIIRITSENRTQTFKIIKR